MAADSIPGLPPDSAFNDWRLVALTPLPTWALVLAAVAVAAAVYFAWRGMSAEGRSARRRILLGLRIAAAVAAITLLLEPGLELLATTKIRGRVAVLFDDSKSMTLPASAGGPTREAQALALLTDTADRQNLETRFQVDYEAFAAAMTPTDPARLLGTADAGTPEEDEGAHDRSLLLPALEEAVRAGGNRPLAGVVIVSDGADTGALDEAFADGDGTKKADVKARLKELNVPIFAIDASGGELRDLALSAVKVDDFAFVRNSVELEVELTQQGFAALHVPVVLEREGQVVTTAEADVLPGGLATVKLKFTPDTTGEFAFTVRTPVQADEAVAANNARSFVLKVIRDRVRVLHVAGRPSWDERFVRMLLKRDPNVDLISFFILRTPSDLQVASNDELSLIPFPTDEIFSKQLKSFDLVIFHNFTYRPYRMAGYLRGIAEYVRDGGAVLMIGGDNSFSEGAYDATAIEDILPVELDPSPQAPSDEEFQPRLTPEGRRHPVTELSAGEALNDAAWKALPPLHGLNRVTLRSDSHALVEHPNLVEPTGRPAPVIAVREVGRGRSMAFMTDSSWEWAFVGSREGRTQRAFDDFYHHAIRWLVRDPDLTQVRLQAEKERYTPDERVAFIVKARSRDYGPAAGARVELEVRGGASNELVHQVDGVVGQDGTLRLDVGRLEPGPWRAHVVARKDGEELGQADDALVVEESGPELARPAPRPDILKFIAEATGGEYRLASATKLSELPLKDPERIEIGQRKSKPIWDRAWVLLVICALLGTEWFLRRRWGFF